MTNSLSAQHPLVIKAKGGFGNRMLSAATGIVLAEILGRRPVIDWRDGQYLDRGINAYPLLFSAPDGPEPAEFDNRADVAPAIWSGRLHEHPTDVIESIFPNRHSDPFVYRQLSIPLDGRDVPEDIAVFWSYLPKFARLRRQIRQQPNLKGRTADEIARQVLADWFQPNSRVLTEVERLLEGCNRPIIGVHVRYTDRKAPLERIERSLASLRTRMPSASVFLATDSAEVQARIQQQVEGVIAIDKELAVADRTLHDEVEFADRRREAENALIDMWVLSRCDWLIHSRNSTFSVAAACVGGIAKERQVDVDRYNAQVVAKRWFQAYA